jgi:tellurite resistance protein
MMVRDMQNSPEQNLPKLQFFPAAFFSVVMGLTGLTLAWDKASVVFGFTDVIAQALLILSASVLLLIVITYTLKAKKYPNAVVEEYQHPIKMSFFPAFSISLILMSIATLHVSKELSLYLWGTGVTIHLGFTIHALSQWIHHPKFKIEHSTPAWFIPVVGNILIPIAGVEHGFIELSWFFFSIGFIYWIILKTLIFNRMFFHEPLPQKLLPTLFILIAPPAVGFISYMKLNAELDNFSRILFYTSMFLVLLLFTQLPRFSKIKFYMSWWAYSFPLAASTIATLVMYQHNPSPFFQYIAIVLLTLSSVVISILFIRTILAIIRNEICLPE